ncbi:MAG: purine-binding chemotaxis protein CheW [Glaciecola sp.]|jgi:purine-binding chemotaxis protein CheW
MKDKNKFAKESIVEDYLTDLLTESQSELNFNKAATQRLLEQSVNDFLTPQVDSEETNLDTQQLVMQQDDKEIQVEVETKASKVEDSAPISLQDSLGERFQALFFEVAGLTLAVPLIELGGIHEITKIAPIIGKPDWFMGVMLKNEDKFNVVDSARWVMPEKYDDEMAENLNYQFLINLGKTSWVLTCEKLINTVELNKSDVKWRTNTGKRPWLAGMVKERMCALINVAELVEMLKAGLSSK